MSFKVCPLQEDVHRFLKNVPVEDLRNRIPIAVRAENLRQKQMLPIEEAKKMAGSEALELKYNPCTFFNSSKILTPEQMAFVIVFADLITENTKILLMAGDEDQKGISISLKAFTWNLNFKDKSIYDKSIFYKSWAYFLKFTLLQDHIILDQLSSFHTGKGITGRAAAALYNIALSLKYPEIRYTLCRNDLESKMLFYNLDFGCPVDYDARRWVVDVV